MSGWIYYQNPVSLNRKQMEINWLITILKGMTVLCCSLLKITTNSVIFADSIYTTYFNSQIFWRLKMRTYPKEEGEINLAFTELCQ